MEIKKESKFIITLNSHDAEELKDELMSFTLSKHPLTLRIRNSI